MHKFYVTLGLTLLLGGHFEPSRGQGFGTSGTPWAVPVGGSTSVGFNQLYNEGNQPAGYQGWSVLDLTGDGRPDLVVTNEGTGTVVRALGGGLATYWRVYPGTATGFGSPISWPVPVGGSIYSGFFKTTAAVNTTAGYQSWTTMDMNADSRPDLVVMAEGNGTTAPVLGGLGSPGWRVYYNTGSGFAATASPWAVPVGGSTISGFNQLYNEGNEAAGYQGWSVLDVTGDRRPDLVVTNEGTGTVVRALGGGLATYWRVYPGTATGFGSPISWPVPVGGSVYSGFFKTTAAVNTTAGYQSWTTMDMNADSRPDLVVMAEGNGTTAPVLGGLGSPGWRVFYNTGSGFAAAASPWAVPVGGSTISGFNQLYNEGNEAAGYQGWAVQDLTGDGRPDLVVTNEGTGTVVRALGGGLATYWRIYPGTAAGFGAVRGWPVPVGGSVYSGFFRTTVLNITTAGYENWTTMDMNNDQRPDLVVLAAGNGTAAPVLGGLTAPYWRVYYNTGSTVTGTAPAAAAGPAAWPNPCHDVLNLRTDPVLRGQPYTLLDPLGRTVAAGTIGQPTQVLDLAALPTGLYLLRLGQQPGLLKVVKE